MKLSSIFALSLLCIINSAYSETTLAAAVAHDHATAQACEVKLGTQKTESSTPEKPVTYAIVDLGIQLEKGYNYPAPGLKMELYPKVDGHVTIETEITIREDEVAHPLVAKILAIIGYQTTEHGYFFDTEPKATQSDSATTIVSVKRPYAPILPYEVQIKLRTLLNDQMTQKYLATLKARKDAQKKKPLIIIV